MSIKNLMVPCVLAALAFSGNAAAALVTFEDVAGTNCVQTQVNSGGLSFKTGFWQCLRNTANNGNGIADNGTKFLNYGYSNLTVTATDGNVFDLAGLDLGISAFNTNLSDNVTLTAFTHGGGTTAQVLNIGRSFASYSFNLTGLDSFSLSTTATTRGYVAVDNINFAQAGTTVPEPASLALIGLALFGLAAARKRSVM